ncbi:MAG: AAA family ATPase [Anaerolineales bacterium]|nr:AAA family ATPase [Anaerolineales bacterium]
MATPILATKLYIPPPRPQVVARPRLLECLNEGLRSGHKLTLVSAPAGSGKTTLISAWVYQKDAPPETPLRNAGQARGAGGELLRGDLDESGATLQPSSFSLHPSRVAWLSLDEGDSDPTRFLTYLVAALQTVAAGIGESSLATLQAPQPPSTETILTALLNEIAALPEPLVLVLDDYHVIEAQAVDQALTFLLEHLPPQLHVLIATREDPQLPLARLRARGQLTEVREADLRFALAEAAEFLNRVMGLNLSAADIAALEARTEGWVAGLQLAALSMRREPDPARFIQTFTGSDHFVLDYLLEEVLQRQPQAIQAFLLRTSILRRLSAPLCDAILGHTEKTAQETLESLERANLFLVPLDPERRWYRYHHLFGDLLRQRLGNPAELAEDHLRASAWYEANNDLAEAFHHALAAGASERAASLAEAAWQAMERSFQTAAWIGWIKRLPQAVVCGRPRLCVQLAWAHSDAGELETSEAYLQHAERALAGAGDGPGSESLPGNIPLIRASNAQNQGDLAETLRYTELAMQLIPQDDFGLRASAAITLGFTHWATGDLELSLQAMHAWRDNMRRLGNPLFDVASAFAVADMQVILGRLREAENALRQAISAATALGHEAEAVIAHHHLGLALLAHERGEAATQTHHLQTAADLGQHTTLVDWRYRWNLAQARLKESAGEWEAALELLNEASRVHVKNAIPLAYPVAAHQARVHLKQGRLDKAQAWARECGLSTEAEARYLDEYELLTLARVRLAEGALAGVSKMLERLLALAETQKRSGSLIEIRLTQALVEQAQQNRPGAVAALAHALALAEPEGYLRTFVDEGEAIRSLLLEFSATIEKRANINQQRLISYVNQLLAAFPHPATLPHSTVAQRTAALVEPMSGRELEVLQLIAQGLTNREISERLCVTISTVKGHNQRLFGKLQAQNRTEAVTRARELGLL